MIVRSRDKGGQGKLLKKVTFYLNLNEEMAQASGKSEREILRGEEILMQSLH